jgi:hypothetical protein
MKMSVAQRNAEYDARIQIAAHHINQGKKIVLPKEHVVFFKTNIESVLNSLREEMIEQGLTQVPGEYIYLALLQQEDRYVIRRARLARK